MLTEQLRTLKVYEIEPRQKHPTIFEWFDNLQPSGAFIIENDHDPIPLYYELRAERKGTLAGFDYLQKGPEIWKVRISKSSENSRHHVAPSAFAPNGTTLDVTSLEPRLKHPTIFEWFAALQPGESFTIKNDHDPKPLYYQMLGELGPVFTWNYNEQGPTQWRVSIGKNKEDELTVGEIAAKDFRKAQVMKEKGIDFCCGGKKSLHQAATEANITPGDLEKAFQEAEKKDNTPTQNFDLWDADFLADYIYNQHHKYFYKNADLISELTAKVRDHHGKNHPELIKLAELVETLFADLEQHFNKEEKVLFPYIKDLTRLEKENIPLAKRINISEGPLTIMHLEHELAGDMLKSIRHITHDYKIPEGACNSFRLLYNMLEDLESDLHQHIHLENNILFPKAIELEKRAVRPNVY